MITVMILVIECNIKAEVLLEFCLCLVMSMVSYLKI